MKKIVIYTCITGGYDGLMQPVAYDPLFDYICFMPSDIENAPTSVGVWSIRLIDVKLPSNVLVARYVKTHPHVLLPDYDFSVWIDGNISIATSDFYHTIIKKVHEDVLFSGLNHWCRDCVYDEAIACAKQRKGEIKGIIRMMRFLKSVKFPKHYGLFETNVLFRKHTFPTIVSFDDDWWSFIYYYCYRDQLSNSYCLWKYSIPFDFLLPKDSCARNSPSFVCVDHHVVSSDESLTGIMRFMFRVRRKIGVLLVSAVAC